MKKPNLFWGLFFTLISIPGFGQGLPDDFDYGQVENGIYTNAFFGIELSLPDGWVTRSRKQMEKLMKKGGETISVDDPTLKAAVKESVSNSASLFIASKFETGTPVDFNPNMMMLAENTSELPGIKTGNDYLFHARKLMEYSTFKYDKISEKNTKAIIDGVEFYIMTAEKKVNKMNVVQNYYVTIRKGYSICIIISHTEKEHKKELVKSVESMRFKD